MLSPVKLKGSRFLDDATIMTIPSNPLNINLILLLNLPSYSNKACLHIPQGLIGLLLLVLILWLWYVMAIVSIAEFGNIVEAVDKSVLSAQIVTG